MTFRDQTGSEIYLTAFPKKIISVVPSQTELLCDLGLEMEVIGITKFCIHPAHWHKNKIKVGGTKSLKIDLIKSLSPDLIIANKEENTKEQIEILQKFFPVWVSNINNLKDALLMIEQIGILLNRENQSTYLINNITTKFKHLQENLFPIQNPTCAYLIWKNPYMVAGGDCFINDMLKLCGFKNFFEYIKRYPEISIHDLKHCNFILLSSEPYPFSEKHIEELKEQLPEAKIILVDGEMFSWYGSKLLKSPEYFLMLLNDIQKL